MPLFSNIQNEIIAQSNKAQKSIKIAVTWFTNHDIFNVLLDKLDKGVDVQLIVLNDSINNKILGLDFQKFIDLGGHFYYSEVDNMVHHKFCIIDDEIVITGSYNWTYYAEKRNWENVIVLTEKNVVDKYLNEFYEIIGCHNKVNNIDFSKKSHNSYSREYLMMDYSLQGKLENSRGNNVLAAKIFTEVLRIDNKQNDILHLRTEVLKSINTVRLEYCPYDIGIYFKNGYCSVIPAYSRLPFTENKKGHTLTDNVTALKVTIQKFDYLHQTIHEFTMNGLAPRPNGTAKLSITLTVDIDGKLYIYCEELNTNKFPKKYSKVIDLRIQ